MRRFQRQPTATKPSPPVEYTDGFGRLLQTRTQAEDIAFGDERFGNEVLAPDQATPPPALVEARRVEDRVVVSGWQTYDNKGQVIEKFQPFFHVGFDYTLPAENALGQKVTQFYDPRGQVVRTLNPDGSEQRVVFGVPASLDDPDVFEPSPWETFTYDENDNAGRTHPLDSVGYHDHWNTPVHVVLDPEELRAFLEGRGPDEKALPTAKQLADSILSSGRGTHRPTADGDRDRDDPAKGC